MFKNLYEKIQRCCGYVTVFEGDEVISEGTCFSFTDTGEVITAAHVVTGRMPIKKGSLHFSVKIVTIWTHP